MTDEELTEMTDTPDSPAPSAPKLGIGISIVLVIATILTIFAFLTIWANRQVLSTDQWTDTSTQLLEKPAVRTALANYLVDTLFNNIDVQAELENNLPPELSGLAGPATGGLRQLAFKGADSALEQPIVQQAWKNANKATHEQLIQILDGGSAEISTANGVVTINTKLLLQQVADQVGVPRSLVDKLPASVGSLTVLKSDELKTAQQASKAVKGLTWVFTLLALLFYIAAIWLAAGRRRRAVFWMGLSLVTVGVIVLLIHSFAKTPLVDALSSTSAVQPAVSDVYDISTQLLKEMAVSILFSGLLVLLATWLAGPYAYAVKFRHAVAPYLREYLPLSIAFAALLFLLMVWWAPTHGFRTTAGLLLNLLLAVSGFVALTLMTRKEFPDAEPADMSQVNDWFSGHWQSTRGWVKDRTQTVQSSMHRDAPTEVSTVDPPTKETVVAAPAADDQMAALDRLQSLRERGALSDEEFAAQKKKLLE
jgi:hypothetical protein